MGSLQVHRGLLHVDRDLTVNWDFSINRAFFALKLLLIVVIYPQITGAALRMPVGIGAREKILVPDSLLYFPLHRPGYVLVVEKSTQKAYLYATNSADRPFKVYPCSTGENRGPKSKRNDKRTPEGVYFTTNSFEKRDLPSIYGAGAVSIDYPNARDRQLGRKGYGIWIHGTNQTLKPWDTNGCVVLRNEDIVELSGYISERQTPIIITKEIKFIEKEQIQRERAEIKRLITDWVEAWRRGDIDLYISFYDTGFTAGGKNWRQWRSYKKRLTGKYGTIEITIDNLQILREGGTVLARFDQTYRADEFFSFGEKRLYLEKKSPEWKVVGEFFKKKEGLAYKADSRGWRQEASLGIKRLISEWRDAWEQKDLQRYMASYSEDFFSQGLDRDGWKRHKSELNRRYRQIRVTVSNLRIEHLSSTRAMVYFDQVYSSDRYHDRGKKTIELIKRNGQWKIKTEMWVPVETGAMR